MRKQARNNMKDSASVTFLQKVITYPLYYDVIKILHYYGLYLEPKHTLRQLAPQFHTMYSVISKNKPRKETTFDDDLDNLTKYNYFSTHYKSLLSATAVLNLKRLNITPSLFFIFLTFYNQWLQERVFDGDEAIVRGGIYAEAKHCRVLDTNPLDNLKFVTPAPAPDCDELTTKPAPECTRFASSISDFALVDTDNRWTSVYKFAMFFFQRNNSMTISTGANTELKEYMEKNEYNKSSIIDLSRQAGKVDKVELDGVSSTEKKKSARKKSQRTQSNTGVSPPQKKIRNDVQLDPPSASLIRIRQKTEAGEETKRDANETAFATFCSNFDWNIPKQNIDTQNFKKELSTLCETITGRPLNQESLVNTTPNNFLKHGNIDGKDKDLQWLADEGNKIIEDYDSIRIVLLIECKELTERIIKQLFGAKNMMNKMASEGWLVLKITSNILVYEQYKSKSNVVTYAPPWAKAALDFVRKAQDNGWKLNRILDKHPTNEYIVLCTQKLYGEMMDLNNGILVDEDENGKSDEMDIEQDGNTSNMNKDDEDKSDTSSEEGKPSSGEVKPTSKRLFPAEKETESGSKKKSKADGKTASPSRSSSPRKAKDTNLNYSDSLRK